MKFGCCCVVPSGNDSEPQLLWFGSQEELFDFCSRIAEQDRHIDLMRLRRKIILLRQTQIPWPVEQRESLADLMSEGTEFSWIGTWDDLCDGESDFDVETSSDWLD